MTFIFRQLHSNANLDLLYLYDVCTKRMHPQLAVLRLGFSYQTQEVGDALAVFAGWMPFLLLSPSPEKLPWAGFCSFTSRCIHGPLLPNYCQVFASSLSNFRLFPLHENGSLGRLWKASPGGIERSLCCDVVGRLARNRPLQADDAKLDIC